MKYIFKRDGVEEEVALERWAWGVIYKDGTELKQFGDDGIFHQIGEVKQEDVALFVMYKPADPAKSIDMVVTEGMTIFHKYRNVKPHYLKNFARVYMFGYKKGDAYHNTFILPDDRIIESDKDNVDLPLFNLTEPK